MNTAFYKTRVPNCEGKVLNFIDTQNLVSQLYDEYNRAVITREQFLVYVEYAINGAPRVIIENMIVWEMVWDALPKE
jgi:hypothetical protein